MRLEAECSRTQLSFAFVLLRGAHTGEDARASLLVSERHIQPGGQNNIVLLERRRAWRLYGGVGHVDIAERILPSQPLADLRHAPKIDGGSILPKILRKVGVIVGLFSNDGRSSKFVAQFLSHRECHKAVCDRDVILSRVVWACQEVQRCLVALDGVESQTAS